MMNIIKSVATSVLIWYLSLKLDELVKRLEFTLKSCKSSGFKLFTNVRKHFYAHFSIIHNFVSILQNPPNRDALHLPENLSFSQRKKVTWRSFILLEVNKICLQSAWKFMSQAETTWIYELVAIISPKKLKKISPITFSWLNKALTI